ncbi:hypothetical protein B0H11DRAFT_2270578 [Mycena galericulata]|nr:hypothetical protein B0H11DRAFT_2273284 [Mycena galericulata]KAJ7509049.1 hypothetical protein B0H11DRAFT_2270578 [Mycena galericulata]
MSVYINGILAPTASYSESLRTTTISSAFAAFLPRSADSVFAVAVDAGAFGLRSMALSCDVSSNVSTSVALGADWAAYLRYSLSCEGFRLDASFNPWVFVSDPSHPLSSAPHLSGTPQPLRESVAMVGPSSINSRSVAPSSSSAVGTASAGASSLPLLS